MTNRNLYFALATLFAMVLYWKPLKALAIISFHSGIYPYTVVIPLLSVCLIYLGKKRIFAKVQYDVGSGLFLLLLALVMRWSTAWQSATLSPNNSLPLVTVSFIVLWIGGFVLCYGRKALRAAAFPATIVFLMVPLPQALLERSIFVLRGCSTQMAGFLFRLGGVPVFRNGFILSLPGTDVEVAEQCSGIRSGLALSITSLLMGYLFLRSPWRRLWLVLAAFPLTIFKNGLRIALIYWLTVHPSMQSLTVWMHRYAGIPFSFLGLSALALLVAFFRKFEETSEDNEWIIAGAQGFEKQRQPRPSS